MLFVVRCAKRATAHLSLQADIGLRSITIRVLHCIKEWNWTFKLSKWDNEVKKGSSENKSNVQLCEKKADDI
jgi:hypothetical protein